jgi:MoaA/NifB/PqqE/SkfB family radical SAM enzyme
MKCDFCYNYFDGKSFDLDLCLKVIDRCIDLGAKVFSIGGGDPFNHKEIWIILEYLKSKDLIVQIDTNGLALNKNDLIHLDHLIDLISLPLDGSNKEIHTTMRNNSLHFDKVIGLLDFISHNNFNYKTKINTIITKVNMKDLPYIGRLLLDYKIDIWSVYEFWPLDKAKSAFQKYYLEEDEINNVFDELEKLPYSNHMYLELNKCQNRYQTYFFTTTQGMVYVNNSENLNEYKLLGNIFDRETIEKFNHYNIDTIREGFNKRYNTELVTDKV